MWLNLHSKVCDTSLNSLFPRNIIILILTHSHKLSLILLLADNVRIRNIKPSLVLLNVYTQNEAVVKVFFLSFVILIDSH